MSVRASLNPHFLHKPRHLLLVAPARPDLLDYWTEWFEGTRDVGVTSDRRQAERRHHVQAHEPERRRADRRHRPALDHELGSTGFAITLQRPRILVVDDDELVRDAVTMMLHVEDYEVHPAGNRAETVRFIDQGAYDLIISELRMPGLDGPSLYRELNRRRYTAVSGLIFMTGSAGYAEYFGFLEETGVPVLAKPFTPEQLQQAVRCVVWIA